MTRLSAAMVARLATVPDDRWITYQRGSDLRTLLALESRGLVSIHRVRKGWFQRTPFGRETAERLARRAK